LTRFNKQRLDERVAREIAEARSEYFEAISKVAAQNSVAIISSTSLNEAQQTAKAAAQEITEVGKVEKAFNEIKMYDYASEEVKQALSAAAAAAESAVESSAAMDAYNAAKSAREAIEKNMDELRESGASQQVMRDAEIAKEKALEAERAAAKAAGK